MGFLGLILLVLSLNYHSDIPLEVLKERYTNSESKFIAIGELQVHYRDEGSGPPLVLVHGTSASLHTWDVWTATLKDQFRVIRMDIPAFGLTGPNAAHDYSINAYCHFLKSFLEVLEVDTCYLAGNSLGGDIVWNFAERNPEIAKRAILIDAAGYKHKLPFVMKLAASPIGPLFKNITPRYIVSRSVHEVYGDDSKIKDSIIDLYYDMTLREGNRDAFIAKSSLKRVYHTDRLSNIEIPTLILWGEADIWIDTTYAYKFHKDLPNSELIIYPGAGHIPMEEIPLITAEDARRFLLK